MFDGSSVTCPYAGKGTGEVTPLQRLWSVLAERKVLLADCLIGNWRCLYETRQRGVAVVTLLVLDDGEGGFDPQASQAAARQALPGLSIDRLVPLEEHEVGGWTAAHRGRRCRSVRDVRTTPERQTPVVLDADLQADAWR